MGPKDLKTLEQATADARAARKPLVLVYVVDDELRSRLLLQALADPAVGDPVLGSVVLARAPWSKNAEDARRWKVTQPGTLVILDPTADEPALIKAVKLAPAAVLRRELEAAAKAVK